MIKILAGLLCLAAVGAAAAEERECSVYALDGLSPGMSFEQARAGDRIFNEKAEFRGDLGYRRYEWQNREKAEKIELHVDINHDPPRVVGVMKTVPWVDVEPADYLKQLIELWGPPAERVGRGAFTLLTWHNVECDVSIRANVMNEPHQVGTWIGINSISFRDDFARRKKERREQSLGESPAENPGGN